MGIYIYIYVLLALGVYIYLAIVVAKILWLKWSYKTNTEPFDLSCCIAGSEALLSHGIPTISNIERIPGPHT